MHSNEEKIEEILSIYEKIDFNLEINKENMELLKEIVMLFKKVHFLLYEENKERFRTNLIEIMKDFKKILSTKEKKNLIETKMKFEELFNNIPQFNLIRSYWSVENHSSYSKGFKNSIFSFVCCLKEKEMKIPKFVLFEILKNFKYNSFPKGDQIRIALESESLSKNPHIPAQIKPSISNLEKKEEFNKEDETPLKNPEQQHKEELKTKHIEKNKEKKNCVFF